MQSNTTVASIAPVFFKAVIIIAILGQKTLHWQLSKDIPSGMYNCNFETISKVLNNRMTKLEMEYGLFIYTIIIDLMLWIRFRKELVMLRLS